MSAHFYLTYGPRWRLVRKTHVSEPRSLVFQFDFKNGENTPHSSIGRNTG